MEKKLNDIGYPYAHKHIAYEHISHAMLTELPWIYKMAFKCQRIARKVAKTNALGFSTYLLSATLSGLGIYLGTKVKDSIVSKKLVTENK